MCGISLSAKPSDDIFLLGTRDSAAPLRQKVELALESQGDAICIDFEGLFVSQSFMDEFLGVLILRHGPQVLDRLVLRNCNEDVRAAARFVATHRSKDF